MSSPINPSAYPNYSLSTRKPRMYKVYLDDSVAIPFVFDNRLGSRTTNPDLGDGALVCVKPDGTVTEAVTVSAEQRIFRPVVHFDQLGLWELQLTFAPQTDDLDELITLIQEVRVINR